MCPGPESPPGRGEPPGPQGDGDERHLETRPGLGRGVDIAREQPKILRADACRGPCDVVITGMRRQLPYCRGKRYEEWVLDDPAGQSIDGVRPIRDEIRRRVQQLIARARRLIRRDPPVRQGPRPLMAHDEKAALRQAQGTSTGSGHIGRLRAHRPFDGLRAHRQAQGTSALRQAQGTSALRRAQGTSAGSGHVGRLRAHRQAQGPSAGSGHMRGRIMGKPGGGRLACARSRLIPGQRAFEKEAR